MPLKIAVIGCWHVHAADYAREALDHPEVELAAIWDDDSERGQSLADRLGVPFVADLSVIWANQGIEGVVITTATSAHRDVMLAAAHAGKNIFTEKLLAPTVDQAGEIIQAADANGRCLVVSLPRLYTGYTTAIQRIIDEGDLGRVSYARVRLSHDGALTRGSDAGWLPERFFEPATAIGGALTDLGCHPVYLVQLFLGVRPDTVSATYGAVTGRAVDDHAVVTVGYLNQAIGVIEAGFVSDDPFTIEVFGTEGALIYSDRDRQLLASGAAFGGEGFGVRPVPADPPGAFEQWVDHIKLGTRADVNLARALELTRLVVAANEAAATGRTVRYGEAESASTHL